MLQKRNILFLVFAFIGLVSHAQTLGHEWIRSYQPYFKIRITQEGVYRISGATLQSAGVNISSVNPLRLQLFNLGIEQPIYLHGMQDGTIDNVDFIEFYATKSDGAFDSLLYKNTSDHPHPFKSYFSDTGYYFLTVLPDTTVVSALRYTNSFDNNYNAFTAEPYHLFSSKFFRNDEYYEGINLNPNSDKYNTSEYTDGEGWGASRVGLGQTAVYVIPTPFFNTSGPQPQLEVKVAGVSDYYLTNPTVNHHVVFSIAPAENPIYTTVDDRTYKGYVTQKFTTPISVSSVGATNTNLRMQVINDLFVLSDFNALLYAKITYPRNYQLAQSTTELVQVGHFQPGLKTYLQFSQFGNGAKTVPYLLDLRTRKRVRGTYNSGNAQFLIDKQVGSSSVYVYDSTDAIFISQIEQVQMQLPATNQQYDFLLVSHPNFAEAASEYEQYRSQQYNVLKMYTTQLYDLYSYGIPHPLAIRRFAQYLFIEQPLPPKYLLLLGKGYQNNLLKDPTNNQNNYVPAIGVPAADNLYTNRFSNNGFEAEIPVGRIAATTNQQAINYLNKLKYYENPDDSLDKWRKNVLHISGGNNANEQVVFKNQLDAYANIISNPSMGANVVTYNKSTNDPVQTNLQEEIQGVINRGVTMMTFLGHGSATVLDVSFGSINTTNNKNKYPLFYFNGCNIGNPSELDPTIQTDIYGPDFVCAADKGAIGWLAHSNLTLDGKLYAQMSAFYNNFNQINYGQSLGRIIQATCEQLTSTDEQLRSHCTQLTLQGDPALRIFSPEYADIALTTTDIFYLPEPPNASMDSFAVGVIISNRGRAITDSFNIRFNHFLPSGQQLTMVKLRIPLPFVTDTVYFFAKNAGTASVGNNTFEISVDTDNEITEGNENNNTISVQRFLPGIGVTAILPIDFSIEGNDSVQLVAQSNNIYATNVEYTFELDTTNDYNSPLKQIYTTTSGALAKWNVRLYTNDTTAYFWRVKLNNVDGAQNVWSYRHFTQIPGAAKGWAQVAFDQYTQVSSKQYIVFDTLNRQLEFTEDSRFVQSKIARWAHAGLGIQDPYFATPAVGGCIGSGAIVAVVYDKRNLQRKQLQNFPYTCTPGFDERYYAFDTRTTFGKNEFVRFVDSIPVGDYVAMYSYYDAGINTWTSQVRNALTNIGSQKAAAAQTFNTAFALVGQKGATVGSIIEDTIFNDQFSVPNSPDTMRIFATRVISGKWFEGTMASKTIGPAKSWSNVQYLFSSAENTGTDRNYVRIYAVNQSLNDSLLIATATNGYDISSLDAGKYPYLRLEVKLVDSNSRTPNQFGYWMVQFEPAAEGAINLALGNAFYNDILKSGDSINFTYAFQNISQQTLDSVELDIQIIDEQRINRYNTKEKLPKLTKGEYYIIQRKISSLPLSGKNTLNISLNADQKVNEVSLINNFLTRDFTVETDRNNPMLDVTFDGYRILSGDYVSPSPIIQITSKDDNPYRLQVDTSTFSVSLKRPGTSIFELIPHQSNQLTFYPASEADNKAKMEYKPEQLPNGLYSLRVQSRDASGNLSGANSYEIDFKVENKSTITHFFPYPNPGTTNIRFVFTLTGAKPPEELLIRIMTISGKTVREIRHDEFGPIKIGQNISQFAWDGTDQFGDRLANGVYLYQVFTKVNGATIERASTKADKYFMHDTGKIYLLR
jgi:hypothetical protein